MPQIIRISYIAGIKFRTGDDLDNENVSSNNEQVVVIDVYVKVLIGICANTSRKRASQVTTTQEEYL